MSASLPARIFTLQNAATFFPALSLVFIHFSPAAASVSLASALTAGLAGYFYFSLKIKDIPSFFWLLILLLAWQLITSMLLSDSDSSQKILIHLPLLGIAFLQPFKETDPKRKLLWAVIPALGICWISLAAVINYFLHFSFLNQMVLESKPLPLFSQVYHIEFSVLQAICTLTGIFLLLNFKSGNKALLYSLLAAITVINIITLHILFVRTGIICFWTGGLILAWTEGKKRKIGKGKIFIALAVLIAGMAVIPSIRNRIVNSTRDILGVIGGKDLNEKSFGQRWEAWRASVQVIKQYPVTGAGMANVETALEHGYELTGSRLEKSNRVMPHNQFLDLMIQSGIPAGLLLLLFFILGIFYAFRRKRTLLLVLMPAFFAALQFESLMERQAGILVFVVFISMAARWDNFSSNS